jgi:TIGR03009 family protein
MHRAVVFSMLFLAIAACWLDGPRATAQAPAPDNNQQWRGSPPDAGAAPTGPTVVPLGAVRQVPPMTQYPALRQRPAPARETPVPFVLSPQESAQLDAVLAGWEQRNKTVRTFECDFVRWRYDSIAKPGDQPLLKDQGVLKYAAPDRGLYEVQSDKPEKWICDGQSIFEYRYTEKKVVEYPLPPEGRGKAIADGPVPFVFGADAAKLKQLYFIRVVTPRNVTEEIWLQVLPRFQAQAANFQEVQILLKTNGMVPFAIQTYDPGGKSRTVYRLDNVAINRQFANFLGNNPFRGSVPWGWKHHVDESTQQQAARPVARN